MASSRKKRNPPGVVDAEFREEPLGEPMGVPPQRPWQPGDGCFPPPGAPGSRFNEDGSPKPQGGPYDPYTNKSPEEIKAFQMGLVEAFKYFNSIPPVVAAPAGAPWGVIASSAVGSALGGVLYHVMGSNPQFLREYIKVVRPQLDQIFGNPDRSDVVHFLLEKAKKDDTLTYVKTLVEEIQKGAHVGAADRAHLKARNQARARMRRRSPRRSRKTPKPETKETP